MTIAVLIALFVPLFAAFFLMFFVAGEQWKAAEEKGRERRMAEHRRNARLLRMDI